MRMVLNTENCERYKEIRKQVEARNLHTEAELLFMNYLFFHLVTDRDKCQHVGKNNAYVHILVDRKPKWVVNVETLEITPYIERTYHRKDRIKERLNYVLPDRVAQLRMLNVLEAELVKLTKLKDVSDRFKYSKELYSKGKY